MKSSCGRGGHARRRNDGDAPESFDVELSSKRLPPRLSRKPPTPQQTPQKYATVSSATYRRRWHLCRQRCQDCRRRRYGRPHRRHYEDRSQKLQERRACLEIGKGGLGYDDACLNSKRDGCTLNCERVLVGHRGEENDFIICLGSLFGSLGPALGVLCLRECILGDFLEVLVASFIACFGGPCVQLEDGRLWTAMPRPSVTSRCPQP